MPEPQDDVLVTLLRDALKSNNETNKDGFDRIEKSNNKLTSKVEETSAVAQRDFRVFAGALLVAFLVSTGVEFYGKLGAAVVQAGHAMTPTAIASTIPEDPDGD